MPFYISAGLIFAYSLYDFKKGFILFVGLKYLLVTNITILSIPGIPLLSLDNLMTILFCGMFLLKRKKLSSAKLSIPWMTPFILLSLTWLICSVFSSAGIVAEMSSFLNVFLKEVLIIWVIWEVIETEDDFKRLFSLFTILTLASCIYGLVEYRLGLNPLNLYTASLNKDLSKVIDFTYSIGARGYRVSSVFEHPIGACMNWGMYVAFVAMAYTRYKEKAVNNIVVLLACGLCLVGIILTKMRTGFFFLLFALLACINFRKFRFYAVVLLGIFGIIALWPQYIEPNINLFVSVFTGDRYAGSDASMRFDQLDAAFELLKLSPLTGLGVKFNRIYSGPTVDRLLGLESIWLQVIVQYGVIGIVAYIITIYYSVILIPSFFKSKPMAFIALAYWLTYSLTSFPGVHVYLFYLIMIYCAKKSNVYKSINGAKIVEWRISKTKIIYKRIFKLKIAAFSA